MLYTKGSFFRHERPQKGRFREFQQFDLEILGEEGAIGDAVVIKVFMVILEELGLKSLTLRINSIGDKECRPLYKKDLVSFFRKKINSLCKDCRRRLKTNPLRILDCKEPGCLELKSSAPQMINYLCGSCRNHFREVLEFLDVNNIPYLLDHYLVRGLDYYSRTVFETFLTDESDDTSFALLGGGRYDFLGDILAGRHLPAVGGAMGVERILSVLKEKNLLPKKEKKPKVFLIQVGAAAKYKSLSLIEEFRKARIPSVQSIGREGLGAQLKIANKLGVSYALILGQKEALDETIIIRDMETGSQETIAQEKIIDYLKKRL
jgi:histidyl-tRNA synthetase